MSHHMLGPSDDASATTPGRLCSHCRDVMDGRDAEYCANCYCVQRLLAAETVEAVDILLEVLTWTHMVGDKIDSMAVDVVADAIRLLARHGRVEIERDVGRSVIARLK